MPKSRFRKHTEEEEANEDDGATFRGFRFYFVGCFPLLFVSFFTWPTK